MTTIFALATPPGKSGVAVIRISGDKASQVASAFGVTTTLRPRYAHYTTLTNPKTATVIDSVLLLYFQAPHSFTGEDVLEIHCHGSRAVIQELSACLLGMDGMRHARAGEFTRRALENGKLDLLQAEALADLIEAETPRQRDLALHQLGGAMSEKYHNLEQKLIETRAYAEVFIDFPEDDIPDTLSQEINIRIGECCDLMASMLQTARSGRHIREGVSVAIIGKPNAGKSTLLNYLAERAMAITSDIPGTTRDAIECHVDIEGVPFRFIDTAGLRDTSDAIESQGVEIARRHISEADIVLLLLDATGDVAGQYDYLSKNVSRETFCVINKSDLRSCDDRVTQNVSRETFWVSAITGEGVELLKKALLASQQVDSNDVIYITRERHIIHLSSAVTLCQEAIETDDLVLKAESLMRACQEVGNIVGTIHIERILDALFSSFCIGK